MLPSNGFFTNFFCPYDKAKLCHRPYCHYKHADTDLGEKIADEVEETEYLFDTNHNSNLRHHSKSLYSVDNDVNASYVPTPVGKCIKPSGILKTNNSNVDQPSTSAIPVYNPTPISKLKELNNSQFTDYTPQYSVPLRKRKKIEEYDPTEVKCVSKKSVTFAEPSEVSLHSDCLPTFSSSEDEVEDSAAVPVFSDDDLDDNVRNLDPPKAIIKAPVDAKIENNDEDLDEKKIDEFSLVDKILVDCKKNEKFLSISSKPPRSTSRTVPQKTKAKKVAETKKLSPDVKKTKIDVSDVYNCDLDSYVPANLNSTSVSNDSKKSKSKEHSTSLTKSSSSKTTDQSKLKSGTSSLSKDKSINKSKAKNSDMSKAKEKNSKESKGKIPKRNDDKAKHSKSNSNFEKSNSNGSVSKTEKNKSTVPLNLEKSSSSSKTSKSGKSDSSDSKLSRSKEAKLQDEKVSSSSILKKKKLEQSLKQSSSSDLHTKTKSKSNNKEDVSKHSSSKQRKESSGSKPNIEKHVSVDKSLSSQSASSKLEHEDEDSSVEEITDDIISLSSDSDTDDECKRIFEETFPESESHSSVSDKEAPSNVERAQVRDMTASQKKRLAHSSASEFKKPMSNARKIAMKQMLNPEQVMYNRYAKIKALQAEHIEQKNSLGPKRPVNSPGKGPEKKRICFTPNQNLLAALEERKKNLSAAPSDFSPLPSTVSKTLKVTNRVAHVPDAVVKARPMIPIDYGSKVPTVVRQKYLNAFIDEYLKFSSTEDEAYESALEEEKKAYQRSSSKAIYMNVASNALNRLRHRPDADKSKKNDGVTSTTKTVSHEVLLNGPLAQRTSFSIAKKKAAPTFELKGAALYEQLMEYLLTEDQLKENGYPMPHPTELGRAVIQGVYANKTNFCNDPFKRTCCRCQKTYYVNVDGDYVRDEECDFHWGRLWKRRIAGAFESRYSCCQGDSESDGCCVSIGHVFEGSEAHALKGFVSTLAKTPPPDNYHGIYALDCEMCYTTAGIELTRISVTGPDHKSVYETFVKPQNKVLDYNTRFSGITEDNLKNERTTIRDVQAVLLCMFNTRTILIGHSLESDLKALKLFHKTVVDTSVVFPHKMGLPFKRALRTLMAEKLNKIIQNDVGGHDSCEDAIACMELMIWKIKEDLKGNR